MAKDTAHYDNFEIIVDRKEIFDKHFCFKKGWHGSGSSPEGRIVCCTDCGKHWYVKKRWADDELVWTPVRWYHYKMRRAIVGK